MGTEMHEETRAVSESDRHSGYARQRRRGNGGVRDPERLASALGWFSIGLGVAQIVTPGGVARLIGVSDNGRERNLIRAIGLREIASGLGILSQPHPAGWVWARVAGDAMDLALLGTAATSSSTTKRRVTAATAAVASVAALDAYCAERLAKRREAGVEEEGITVTRAITVNRPPEEVYRFWRRLENLPRFMRHLESVEEREGARSHWKVAAPAGMSVEWDAEMVEDVPNERISWRSLEGSDVPNEGTVTFRPAPGERGTEVLVQLHYDPPAGKVGKLFAKLFREEPGQQVYDDLRAFKQVLETGEILVSDATLRRGPHAAHPPGRLGERVSSSS